MSRKLKSSLKNLSRSLITQQNPKSPVSEQYRTIRSNIQFSSIDQKCQTIMLTSPGKEEGKSTTAANLAVVLAQQGKKVLLVDTDLRKPTVHYTFQLSNLHGLTTVLTKEIALERAFQESAIPGLSVLTCGPIPPNPSELLASLAMESLIADVKESFDYIIFDTPPVLLVTDAQILASKCDGCLLVVASGITEKEAAAKANEQLKKAKSRMLGAVLNGQQRKEQLYYYGG
ncbi:CpsD/CapB family tyrosine-protein kinase [Fictibacillus sp. KIGAM418]|uniref:non-specific protein-tyrosine kinase n=1 Tax=Fictibacillus marinisediminis TaxID=2878389 RepID=A0A9X1XJR8_9BACL|nr:CpsD/CapB family tyrosine-protein kinase [Fictibacillus marinisediminis]MCK6258824.1 CpsD/CapB family tyrosine-protein kinase [Fictibacillus marinisediminis]